MPTNHDFASNVIANWRRGAVPDARQVLVEHPELDLDKSTILELAYEEFCLRAEAGEILDSTEFCTRFRRYQTSLARLLEVHDFFAKHPDLANEHSAIQWPDIGEHFLGFTIVQEIGRGGIGRVYSAQETALGNRTVVIKVSKGGLKEAHTLGKLNHPNIVPVHSVQQDPATGLSVVCMPYLGQTTLCDVLDRAFSDGTPPKGSRTILEATSKDQTNNSTGLPRIRLPAVYADAVIDLAIQLTDALVYTHSQNIVHGDLKPSNILVRSSGQLMLLDFNLSTYSMSTSRPLGGTLPYMSPEQVLAVFFSELDEETVVDARSDIYSLGVILYELLTGYRPFDPGRITEVTPSIAKTLLAQISEGPVPICTRNPAVDRQIAKTVHRCLAQSPQERFQDAAELRHR